MTYDIKCCALAQSFLRDRGQEADEGAVTELAQRIQDAIEDFLTDEEWMP